MSIRDLLFLILAAGTCGGAVAVVLTPTVARMAAWLIVTLVSSAGLFFLLGADLTGVAQLLVYVGGTLVLLIFGAMLTAGGARGVLRTPRTEVLVTGVLSIGLIGVLLNTVLAAPWPVRYRAATVESGREGTTLPLGLALLGVRVDRTRVSSAPVPGAAPGYLLPFELISVHLLVVLVGAAYLARAKRRVTAAGVATPTAPKPEVGLDDESFRSRSAGGPEVLKGATWPTT
jgi:NADH-quinone oxidoreductase subunit J